MLAPLIVVGCGKHKLSHPAALRLAGVEVDAPMGHLGQGWQRHWLKEKTA